MVRIVLLISFLIFSFNLHADTLFEGYSKILSGGVHVGYIVIRYEYNPKSKQFIATSFLKTNELGGNLSEGLKGISAEDMSPVSYQYTTMVGTQAKTIDVKFQKGQMSGVIKDGKKVDKISKPVGKGIFLSQFLAYVMMKSPTGLKSGTNYEYQAIAEEDAAVSKGLAIVGDVEQYNGFKTFKISNEFKGAKFISYVNEKGEVFATKSPAQSIATELVAQPSQATTGFPVPANIIKALFGDVPTGQKNEVSKKSHEPSKQEGVPQGQGLQLKGQPGK